MFHQADATTRRSDVQRGSAPAVSQVRVGIAGERERQLVHVAFPDEAVQLRFLVRHIKGVVCLTSEKAFQGAILRVGLGEVSGFLVAIQQFHPLDRAVAGLGISSLMEQAIDLLAFVKLTFVGDDLLEKRPQLTGGWNAFFGNGAELQLILHLHFHRISFHLHSHHAHAAHSHHPVGIHPHPHAGHSRRHAHVWDLFFLCCFCRVHFLLCWSVIWILRIVAG